MNFYEVSFVPRNSVDTAYITAVIPLSIVIRGKERETDKEKEREREEEVSAN